MTDTEIDFLKRSERKRVELRCKDGEILLVHVISVSTLDRDVVFDLISTNRPERYSAQTGAVAYLTPFGEIENVGPVFT